MSSAYARKVGCFMTCPVELSRHQHNVTLSALLDVKMSLCLYENRALGPSPRPPLGEPVEEREAMNFHVMNVR